MCGIAGYVGSHDLDDAVVERTLALMHRRGPDHAAFRRFRGPSGRHTVLLHSRLAILDLEARSNQPFVAGSRCLVYNGEIYNYLELRAEVERAGTELHTKSDTEVLLAMLARHGVDGLDRCEGMWAFAMYDEATGALLLSRDRFGEKPLHLYRDDTGLYFASELKLVFSLLGRRLPVELDQLRRYLVNGYKALYKQPRGFFQGASEVPRASWVALDAHGAETRGVYWEPRFLTDEGMTFADAAAGARERLIKAVALRLRSDVPLAFCMSGGIDSNALISIARRCFSYDVHGFTILNEDERYEESDLVELAVRELGIRHTGIPADTRDFLPRLRMLVRQHDAPVYTITYYVHWLLMEQIAAHGYRISISGTAADELFSGYFDHHLAYLYEVREDPTLHAASVAAWQHHIRPVVRNPYLQDPELFTREPSMRGHIFLDADRFAACLTEPWAEPFEERRYVPGLLQNRMLNELFHESVPVILHEDDLNAMYYSIENRSPFLDRGLFEYCYSIPARHLVRDGAAKAVLREAMRGIVPDAILDSRRKVGFNAPIHAVLDVRNAETRAELLAPSPIWDVVRRDKIVEVLDRDFLPNSQSKFLFYFLCAKMFLEEFAG